MGNSPAPQFGALGTLALAIPLLVACQPAERGQMAGAEGDTAAATAAVDSLREAYVSAYNAGAAERVAALYAADAVLLPADAPPVESRDSIRTFLDRELAPGPTLQVESHETIPLSPDWISSGGVYQMRVTPENAEALVVTKGSYLVLSRRTESGWKLYRHAITLDSLPAPGQE